MSVAEADIAFARDLFHDLDDLTERKMFGGVCFYSEGTVFALLSSEGRLHLKARGALAEDLAAQGGVQFYTMPYWSLPAAALDGPDAAVALARRALRDLADQDSRSS